MLLGTLAALWVRLRPIGNLGHRGGPAVLRLWGSVLPALPAEVALFRKFNAQELELLIMHPWEPETLPDVMQPSEKRGSVDTLITKPLSPSGM